MYYVAQHFYSGILNAGRRAGDTLAERLAVRGLTALLQVRTARPKNTATGSKNGRYPGYGFLLDP